MVPNLYVGNGCCTKHLFVNGCLGFQAGITSLKTNISYVSWKLMVGRCFISFKKTWSLLRGTNSFVFRGVSPLSGWIPKQVGRGVGDWHEWHSGRIPGASRHYGDITIENPPLWYLISSPGKSLQNKVFFLNLVKVSTVLFLNSPLFCFWWRGWFNQWLAVGLGQMLLWNFRGYPAVCFMISFILIKNPTFIQDSQEKAGL